ncbi:MAG: ComF family protein [Candidatus Omnitrophica bacterium]|nr:ComF family protein [Candidatus Omnitrophota bacterium]
MILFMLKEFINGLKDIIYPKVCISCKISLKNIASMDEIICNECWNKIQRNLPPFCYKCGRHLDAVMETICNNCLKNTLYFDRAFSPCVYEGIIKELIHEFKYKNKDYLGYTLSKLMIEFIKNYNLPMNDIDLIIPIPLHKTRLREREFNQAKILGFWIAKEFNKTMSEQILLRNRYTKTQTELEYQKRNLNVKDSFLVRQKDIIKNKNLLLVDDVLTTGATTSWAAYALKNSGANMIFVLTLAS